MGRSFGEIDATGAAVMGAGGALVVVPFLALKTQAVCAVCLFVVGPIPCFQLRIAEQAAEAFRSRLSLACTHVWIDSPLGNAGVSLRCGVAFVSGAMLSVKQCLQFGYPQLPFTNVFITEQHDSSVVSEQS